MHLRKRDMTRNTGTLFVLKGTWVTLGSENSGLTSGAFQPQTSNPEPLRFESLGLFLLIRFLED